MAALFNKFNLKIPQNIIPKLSPLFVVKRGSAVPPKKKVKRGQVKHRNLIKSTEQSLANRGFLRSYKPYTPPEDAAERVQNIITTQLGSIGQNTAFSASDKFKLLNALFQEFNHSVPNSLLCHIETPFDVLKFYLTPVSTTTPLDELRNKELPPNLHVMYDYVRFHPDTDTMFGGVTAYPESSTLVTGLKYKDKYKGHTQRPPAHYDNWGDFIKHDEYKP